METTNLYIELGISLKEAYNYCIINDREGSFVEILDAVFETTSDADSLYFDGGIGQQFAFDDTVNRAKKFLEIYGNKIIVISAGIVKKLPIDIQDIESISLIIIPYLLDKFSLVNSDVSIVLQISLVLARMLIVYLSNQNNIPSNRNNQDLQKIIDFYTKNKDLFEMQKDMIEKIIKELSNNDNSD